MTEIDAVTHFKALLAVEEQKFLGGITKIESILAEREKTLDERGKALEIRLHGLNELRGNTLSKTEYESKHRELENRIKPFETWMDREDGKKSRLLVINIVTALIALSSIIVSVVFHMAGK